MMIMVIKRSDCDNNNGDNSDIILIMMITIFVILWSLHHEDN